MKKMMEITSKLFFISVISLLFIGCTSKQCTPVVEIKEVKVPVYPEIPNIKCEFTGEGMEPVQKLLECLSLHKTVLDSLRKK